MSFPASTPSSRQIETIRFGRRIPYRDAYDLQCRRRQAVEEGRAGNALFLLEHEPVITLGRKARREHVLQHPEALRKIGIAVEGADRGGDVTYHGPGQFVAYPILDLRLWQPSVRWYLRTLEEVLIRQLAEYGLEAARWPGFTGVWVAGAKVAAIGVGIHNWVTFHGLALNVDPDLTHFAAIVPCGIKDKPVTSLKRLLGAAPTMTQVMDDFERHFRACFEAH